MQTVGEWWMWTGFLGFVLAMLALARYLVLDIKAMGDWRMLAPGAVARAVCEVSLWRGKIDDAGVALA